MKLFMHFSFALYKWFSSLFMSFSVSFSHAIFMSFVLCNPFLFPAYFFIHCSECVSAPFKADYYSRANTFFDTAPSFEAWETHRYLENRLGIVRARGGGLLGHPCAPTGKHLSSHFIPHFSLRKGSRILVGFHSVFAAWWQTRIDPDK